MHAHADVCSCACVYERVCMFCACVCMCVYVCMYACMGVIVYECMCHCVCLRVRAGAVKVWTPWSNGLG